MGIYTSALFCYSICYPWYVLLCPVLMSKSPQFGRLVYVLSCFCVFMILGEYHWAWTTLSVWSTIWEVLKPWTICRLVVYSYIHLCPISGSAAGPHLPSVAWDSFLFCHVISCSILLALLIMYGRERMGSRWFFLTNHDIYFYIHAWFVLYTFTHCSAFLNGF